MERNYAGDSYTTVQKFGVCKIFLHVILLTRLHLFDQKCSKISIYI